MQQPAILRAAGVSDIPNDVTFMHLQVLNMSIR